MSRLERLDLERPPIAVEAGIIKHLPQMMEAARVPVIAAQKPGSFTEPEWAGNSQGGRKRVFFWDEANKRAYNAIGLENPGIKNASPDIKAAVVVAHDAGQLIVPSITTLLGEKPAEVLPRLAEQIAETGADGVELNGSCPNLDPAHALLCEDVDESEAVAIAVRERVGSDFSVIFKVSALPSQTIRHHKERTCRYLDGVTAINTMGNQESPLDPMTGKQVIEVNNGRAGMSGPAIRTLARDNLVLWTRPKGINDFDVLSAGGIDTSVSVGEEIVLRHQIMGAFLVGGAQEFYRKDIASVARRWADGYHGL